MSNRTKIKAESIVVETETHDDVLMLREPLLASAIAVTPDPPSTSPEEQPGRYMLKALCCSYVAVDCNNIECGCKGEQDILCIRHACCLSLNSETRACGCSTPANDPDKICNLGCLCCDVACVKPRTCISGASQVCCLYHVSSFPCSKNYVDECVCAFCFWSCAPKCGCCVAPPKCPALNKHCTREAVQTITMDRRVETTECWGTDGWSSDYYDYCDVTEANPTMIKALDVGIIGIYSCTDICMLTSSKDAIKIH